MERISKEKIARNLERAIRFEAGMRGLQILLYGWFNFRKYGEKYRHAVNARDYLFVTEVMDLSEYAGYDLAKSHCDD